MNLDTSPMESWCRNYYKLDLSEQNFRDHQYVVKSLNRIDSTINL